MNVKTKHLGVCVFQSGVFGSAFVLRWCTCVGEEYTVDFGHFSLPKKKRYAKNIRIGDPYDP